MKLFLLLDNLRSENAADRVKMLKLKMGAKRPESLVVLYFGLYHWKEIKQ